MSHSLREDPISPPGFQRRRAWLVVALLFAATIAGTHAARLWAFTMNPASTDARDLIRHTRRDLLSFEGRLDRGAVHVGSSGEIHLELKARGAELPERAILRRPTDVVVVLDRSGSMGGDPMAKALAAIRELIGQLGPEDRFALVTYSNGSDLVVPLARASDAAREVWPRQLGAIAAGGGTNMSAGLDRAHDLVAATRAAGRVARVLLLSDGHANQGDATPEGLSNRSGRAVSGEYVLSTVGVGEGFDERLMTRLADAGTGNFYYVPQVSVLAGIFSDEFESARATVASALEIRIETPEGIQVVDAAGYPIEVLPGFSILRPGALFAGQERSFWVTLRVPAEKAGAVALGDIRLAYTQASGGARRELHLPEFPVIAAVIDERQFVASLDKDAVTTHHAEERVNRIRQSVSDLISKGEYDAARQRLDDVDYSELNALGIDAESTGSFRDVQEIKKKVERAAAAPAAKQTKVRSQLGKELYEAGTDGRRKGAKR
ncbi:MAG: VWA domain-containing protein [bacterium]|nr:VWA domain-containing protein [bacterium]